MTTPLSTDDRRPSPPWPRPGPGDSGPPPTIEQLNQLAQAKLRAKKVRRAATVATTNGYLLSVFSGGSFLLAAVSLLFGEFNVVGLVMGVGLALVAWNEFRGRAMLRRFEPRGCRVLGWNQLGLMALVIGYAAWMLARALWGANPYAELMTDDAALAGPLGSMGQLYETVALAVYGGLIAGTLIFQGLNSLYYFTRRKHVEAYLSETPEWVVELQRRGVGG